MSLEPQNLSLPGILLARLFSPVMLARVFFVLMVTYLGYQLRPDREPGLLLSSKNLLYTTMAFSIGVVVVIFEYATNIISSKNMLQVAGGLLFGLITAFFFYPIIPERLAPPELSHAACAAIFGYLGIVLAIKHAERFQLRNLRFVLANPQAPAYILDTSAIIDGRVGELMNLNVLRGPVIVPQFVLNELQGIADSPESQRRARGRRGLEILEKMRKKNPDLRILAGVYPDIADVDQKLVEMAKETLGHLVTNDYNLEKVASLQKIEVININELANALRPAVFVGHTFQIDIMREGKEPHQGVGYLDDGTMVVVDEGRPYVGQGIEIIVTSILQTGAGRMVFARPRRGAATVVKASESS